MSPFYANYGFHPPAMNPASTDPSTRTPRYMRTGAHCARRIQEMIGRRPGADAQVHRSVTKGTPRIPGGIFGHAQQAQRQNASPLEKTGPQELWLLPCQECRVPTGHPPHVTPKMENTQHFPRHATRTIPNQRAPSTAGHLKTTPGGGRHRAERGIRCRRSHVVG